MEEVLLAYARGQKTDDLFSVAESSRREKAMEESIQEIAEAIERLHYCEPWSPDIKASDAFLDPLFTAYFKKLGMDNLLLKNDYHILADLVPRDRIDAEIAQKLDSIVGVAGRAKPKDN